MAQMNSYRHFGVYGICLNEDQILVIKKRSGHKKFGPYQGRFDLPGGHLEDNESLATALKRELEEETGLIATKYSQIGLCDFFVRYQVDQYTHDHHIALFYLIEDYRGEILAPVDQEGQDAEAACWLQVDQINKENSSPLLLQAVSWLRTKQLPTEVQLYNDWSLLSK